MGVSSSAVDRHMCDESSVPWLRPVVEGLPHQRPIHKSTALSSTSTMDHLPRSKSFTQPWNAIPTEDEEQEQEDEDEKEPDDDHVDPARATAPHNHRVGSSAAHKKRLASIQTMPKPTITSSHTPSPSLLETSIQEKLVGHEILIDRVESLKRVDFSLFFASVRLYLNVIQAVAWLKDDILDYLWTTEHVLRVPVPLTDDYSIELTKWKVALLKRAASNTTNLGNSLPSQSKTTLFASGTSSSSAKQALRQGPSRVTHNYHLHTHQSATNIAALLNAESSSSGHHNNAYGEQDVSQWKRTLLLVLEEERTAMMISVGVLVERFVKALLHYK
eukprot:gene500-334_t